MSDEELRELMNTEIKKDVTIRLDSSLIFAYIQSLEKQNNKLKEILRERLGYLYE